MLKPQWRQDIVAAYERYTWGPWVVYRNGESIDRTTPTFTVYDKRRLGEGGMDFETLEHAQQYAETMEAVGA